MVVIVKLGRVNAHGVTDAKLRGVQLEVAHLLLHEHLWVQKICLLAHLGRLVLERGRILMAAGTSPRAENLAQWTQVIPVRFW